jgi:hypothetical protein
MARFPYPGLTPFERDDADIFFGREKQVDAMIDRLGRQRLLAVTGNSGSGKSSLVRAGLLEALEIGLLADAGAVWRFAVMRPRDHPMAELATALLQALGGDQTAEGIALRRAALDRGPLSLVEELRNRPLPDHANLLLLVDQFEELFRYERLVDREEAEAFVALLLASAAQREVPIYVVLTMRSDFFGECARFEGLAETICDSLFLCPRLTRDQIIAAIEGPARVFHGRIEPALTSCLANDMGTDPDQLPLMQHVMMRLWDGATARDPKAPLLLTKDYLAAGGLKGSLSRHADEVLESVARDAPELRDVVRRLFCLVTDGDGSRATRRLTPVREVMGVADQPIEEVTRVANAYRAPGCNLVLPPAAEALTPATVLDITHEALIRNWTTLREWAREEDASAAQYREIEQRVQRQTAADAPPPLDPQELQSALDWIERERPNAAWAARYGGDFNRMRGFIDMAAARQKKSIWAIRLALALITIEAAALAISGNNLFLIWVGMVGWIYGSLYRNLTRNFAAARQWAHGWAGFLIVVVIAVTIRVARAHEMLVSEGLGIPTIMLASLCLAFASVQLRPLALRRRAFDPAGVIDLRRLRQGRLALISALAVLALIGCGQLAVALAKGNYNIIYDATFTWIIAVAVYVSVYRNLTRNFAVAIGSVFVWLVIGACFVAFNISTGDRLLAAADSLAELCFVALLARLWPDIRRGKSASPVVRGGAPTGLPSLPAGSR